MKVLRMPISCDNGLVLRGFVSGRQATIHQIDRCDGQDGWENNRFSPAFFIHTKLNRNQIGTSRRCFLLGASFRRDLAIGCVISFAWTTRH